MNKDFVFYLLSMALVTYLIRMVPFTLMRKKINSVFIKSFLYYVPYAVLSAMTFPYIFYATGSMITSISGCLIAFIMAYINRPLIEVAAASCAVAYVLGLII